MPSPPRPPAGSSPSRPALHERSDSHANQKPAPSLRLVGGPEASVYESSPYPTKPSQILRPSKPRRQQAPSFEIGGYSGSQSVRNSWTPPSSTVSRRQEASGQGGENATRNTWRFSADALSLATSGEGTVFALTPDLNSADAALTAEEAGKDVTTEGRISSDSVVQLPSVPPRAQGHSFPASRSTQETVRDRQPSNKDSDGSLNSTNSTGTVIVKKNRDGRKRASYTAFPFSRPSSSRSNSTVSTLQKPTKQPSDESLSNVTPILPGSPGSDPFSTSREHRSVSLPAIAPLPDDLHRSVEFQYPIIKPQSVSASWAHSSSSPQRTVRTTEREQERWNPHLSTVPSEGASLFSGERSSQLTGYLDSSRASKTSSNVLSDPRISVEFPPVPSNQGQSSTHDNGSQAQMPGQFPPSNRPGPFHGRQRDFSGSTIRVVPPEESFAGPSKPRSRDVSGTTVRLISNQEIEPVPAIEQAPVAAPTKSSIKPVPQENGNSTVLRPSSRASFFRESIPAWARSYYTRPTSSATLPRPESRRLSTPLDNMTSNVSNTRYGPSGKPRELRRSTMRLGPRPGELNLVQAQGLQRKRISPTWSPHLWHDRTAVSKRRSIFKAPSLDERAEGLNLNKRTIQIACFAVGFIFPLAWLIASFLPLPDQPGTVNGKGKETMHQSQLMEDLESQVGPVDDARYENARWWRIINRAMALVGISLVAVIIALAVVGAT